MINYDKTKEELLSILKDPSFKSKFEEVKKKIEQEILGNKKLLVTNVFEKYKLSYHLDPNYNSGLMLYGLYTLLTEKGIQERVLGVSCREYLKFVSNKNPIMIETKPFQEDEFPSEMKVENFGDWM